MSSPHRPATPAPSDIPAAPDVSVPDQRSVNTRQKEADPNAPLPDGTQAHEHSLPKLPHERDQSVNMTDGIPSADMQQAYRDVERGLVDTDAGREAHNIGNGKPVVPADPVQPGSPPVEPDHR